MPGRLIRNYQLLASVVWRIPEDLRMELALLDRVTTVQAYALYVNYEIYCVN